VLFSSEIPLPVRRLTELTSCAKGDVLAAIDRLNVFYAETNRAFRIAELAGGFQMVTTPEHAETLGALHKERVPSRLSRAALETLSIIAFKQPATRAEIDAIRGVSASDRVLRNLIERKLVRIAGRAELPGRPLLYGTTREFLAYFGLASVSDLPRTDELNALLEGRVNEEAARELSDPALDSDDAPLDSDETSPASFEEDAPDETLEERDSLLDEPDPSLDENEVIS
jgi:segregation and condensation protein B